ncbi:hypothetical protein [Tengunoibacter tsumagoiensis]|uniref:Polysaccharide chain length determinant N-terminal domain-containing protein n=1 Tax=Tengunoibacter tsumagoiensis TaxID=2014871 RepID=A0A401ZXW4_9CHLR|nr:hypothetical protein [Tengunoibacter tsumagoiensis]GCE11673.1 hypothetical protein KTT_15320 [Tengunoibacter tsumagoiensis]
MELRAYGQILRRRLWVILLVVAVVSIYAGYLYYSSHKLLGEFKTYRSSIVLRVGLQAAPATTTATYADYITVNEALAEEFATGPILNSEDFGKLIVQQLRDDHTQITALYGSQADLGDWQNARAIAGALSASRTHGLVTIQVNWNAQVGAWAIAHAVGEVSHDQISHYLDYEVRSNSDQSTSPLAAAQVVTDASEPTATLGAQTKTLLPLLLLVVGLIVGIALAFLVEYLDDRIYQAEEVAQLLELPIYGRIPPAPKTTGKTSLSRS